MKLPDNFESYFRDRWESTTLDSLFQGLEEESPVSIRLNPARLPADALPEGADGRVPWCPEGVYLRERPVFTADPLLHAGAYYVQEASSMFLAHVVRSLSDVLQPMLSAAHSSSPAALDLCAAPGGKSTLLRSLLPDECLLVANEPVRARAQVLAENLAKWGHPNVLVTQAHARDFAHFTEHHTAFGAGFGFILTDVPCSGEGMFRKEEEALRQWSPAFVAECAALQRSILADVWPALKPGGLLVYSTCTFNHLEDEENVEWICRELGAEVLEVDTDSSWGITGHYHFLPDSVRGEGFFLSALRKSGDEPLRSALGSRERRARPVREQPFPSAMRSWVRGDFDYRVEDDLALAFPSVHAGLRPLLRRHLHVLAEGVCIAEMRGCDWQPAHALAMSQAYVRGTFPEAALTYDEALAYLRREAIQVDAPRGYVLVTFRDLPLGFVKNLGSRANTLYPAEWRIRSGYATADPPCTI